MINFKRIYSCVFSCICMLGFLLQLQQISELYFRFQTTSRTEYRIRDVEYYQTIMYCPRSFDLMDKRRYKMYGLLSPKNSFKVQHNLRQLTINDILELTPEESEAINSCVVRQGIVSTPLVMKQKECRIFFKVSKSVTGETICYTFMPRILGKYSVGGVATSQTHSGYSYRLTLNSSIGFSPYATIISAVINQNNEEDFLNSRAYASRVFDQSQACFSKSKITVLGESTDIHRLPPPYDTKCTYGHNREKCYDECLDASFKTIDRASWSSFHREKLSLKMVTQIDLENETVSEYINQTFKACHLKCKIRSECFIQFSRTTTQIFSSQTFTLSSMLPSLPHMSVYAVPCLNPIEYIVQVGSCFGIWFGLSIISFNPLKLKILLKKNPARQVNSNRVNRLFNISKKTLPQ